MPRNNRRPIGDAAAKATETAARADAASPLHGGAAKKPASKKPPATKKPAAKSAPAKPSKARGCDVRGCDKPHHAGGMCSGHYTLKLDEGSKMVRVDAETLGTFDAVAVEAGLPAKGSRRELLRAVGALLDESPEVRSAVVEALGSRRFRR